MKLGFSELLMILLIALILLGPRLLPRLETAWQRTQVREARRERRLERQKEELRRRRELFFRRLRRAIAIALGAAAAAWLLYLCFGPLPYEPQKYAKLAAADTVAAEADHTADTQISLAPYSDPICVAEQEGWLYAAVDGGKVVRIRPDGTGLAEVLSTGGAVTALAFGPDGALYLTDAAAAGTLSGGGALYRASFDGWAVSLETILTSVDGRRLQCPAGLAVGSDGTLYFTDFGAVPAAEYGLFGALSTELAVHDTQGKLYAYDPESRKTECVAEGMCGAAGVALSTDEKRVYVAEAGACRVWAVDAAARGIDLSASAPDAVLVLDALPGYPAGLAVSSDGTLRTALCGSRIGWLDHAAGQPLLRRMVLHLPRLSQRGLLLPKAEKGRILACSGNGGIVRVDIDTAFGSGRLTGVCAVQNGCWLANADGDSLYFAAGA